MADAFSCRSRFLSPVNGLGLISRRNQLMSADCYLPNRQMLVVWLLAFSRLITIIITSIMIIISMAALSCAIAYKKYPQLWRCLNPPLFA